MSYLVLQTYRRACFLESIIVCEKMTTERPQLPEEAIENASGTSDHQESLRL